jgi:hypothetical protein
MGEFAIHKAMRRTSGGIGKKEDSQNASAKSASPPYGVLAQCITQTLKSLTQSKISMKVLSGENTTWRIASIG